MRILPAGNIDLFSFELTADEMSTLSLATVPAGLPRRLRCELAARSDSVTLQGVSSNNVRMALQWCLGMVLTLTQAETGRGHPHSCMDGTFFSMA